MIKNIINNIINLNLWLRNHSIKIFYIIVLHLTIVYISDLPYFNLIKIIAPSLVFFVDWIAILLIFKPKMDSILKIGIILFFINCVFAIVKIYVLVEALGNISYLLIATYIVLSLKEIKEKGK